MVKSEEGIRQKRKSRGRGLRATTGCLICKKRHVKCDEVHPQCGPCSKGQRPCVYAPRDAPRSRDAAASLGASESPPNAASGVQNGQKNAITSPLQVLVDACHQDQQAFTQESPRVEEQQQQQQPPPPPHATAASTSENAMIPTPKGSITYVPSPGTESSVTSRVAPLSWFELLATDAANADDRFLLSPPRQFSRSRLEPGEDPRNSSNLRPRTLRERESFHAAAFPRDPEIEQRFASQTPESAPVVADDPLLWTSDYPVALTGLEHYLFRHFVRVSSKWLDFYDPELHFATTVPHIALRNVGLMKALLALSARHLSLCGNERGSFVRSSVDRDGSSSQQDVIDRNLAVQYYFESLHYLNKAMQRPSYARSLDLIATSILISTYEMIDGSNQDWERHLKGVFWIQRFQDNDGESGGLRSAVWWAWLRQDVWVAMRERRRVFSFWNPKKPVSMLSSPELATRATYLLAQCVNYASKEEEEASELERRLDRGSELLFLLQEWHECLPPEYSPLPSASEIQTFPPIWVNPPSAAAALQIHSLARILVILHRPSSGGLDDYRAAQHVLALSVSTICGIARSVDEDDDGANIVSLNCLFGAGMCVNTPHERLALLDLLDMCQRRVRWPLMSLRKELELEYSKDVFNGLMR